MINLSDQQAEALLSRYKTLAKEASMAQSHAFAAEFEKTAKEAAESALDAMRAILVLVERGHIEPVGLTEKVAELMADPERLQALRESFASPGTVVDDVTTTKQGNRASFSDEFVKIIEEESDDVQ